jgi:hypothetical protein
MCKNCHGLLAGILYFALSFNFPQNNSVFFDECKIVRCEKGHRGAGVNKALIEGLFEMFDGFLRRKVMNRLRAGRSSDREAALYVYVL